MNYIKKISIILIFLCITLAYTTNITSIPNKVVLFENEDLNLGQMFGITLKEEKEEVLETSSSSNRIEDKTITLSLFNLFNVKKVDVSTISKVRVIPLGNTVGIKLYANGVLVIRNDRS